MIHLVDKEFRSSFLLRIIGYCLLMLTLFDVIALLVPLRLMNPNWEIEMIGQLVGRSPVALLGLGLVFYRETDFRSKWELQLLKVFSWASLLIGMLFLLLMPLVLVDNSRIDSQIIYEHNTQLTQQLFQLQEIENKVSNGTDKDINDVANLVKNKNLPLNLQNPQLLKSRLVSEIAQAKQRIPIQAEADLKDKRLFLRKNSTKLILGTLVSGVAFVYIWYITRWARRGYPFQGS